MTEERWRIQLLGGLQVRRGDRVLAGLQRQQPALLLAYLAFHAPSPRSRDTLADLLWPEADLETGRHNLRSVLHALRRLLEPTDTSPGSVLVADHTTVRLQPAAVTTDVLEFRAALADAARAQSPQRRAASLAAAVDLYRGELLPDFYEPWVLTERPPLAEAYLAALHRLALEREQAGDLEGALDAAQRAISADPLREEAHYDVMRLYAAAGQPQSVLRQYQELERVLREELEETPSAEARALAEELRQSARTLVVARRRAPMTEEVGRRPAPPADAARGEGTTEPRDDGPRTRSPAGAVGDRSAASAARRNGGAPSGVTGKLPVQWTRFYGRQEEIARLTELLASSVSRLVTVTGPGGSGKTRLVIAAVGRLVEAPLDLAPSPQAVAFVALADLTDAGRIPEAIADALGLDRSPEVEVLEQVIGHLSAQPWLLVLDNYEHLVEEGALWVRTLLERAPTLTCLVTSRQRLGITGEQELALLPLPTPRRGTVIEQLGEYASVQLFVDRARAVRSDFALTAENAASVAELCDRLEGLPLALELAAARIAVLSPQEMLGQLERRFTFLVTRQRDTPARHRTLRAVIEGSYQLLDGELQRFFARLSVFRGGWTLEAAQAVCDEGAPAAAETSYQSEATRVGRTLDYLEQLRDCSLLTVEEEGRYRLLETLREYAWEQLAISGERAEIQRRHRDWYLQLAEQADAAARGPGQKAALTRLEGELENLRAVLAWCQEEADADPKSDAAEAGLRLATALWWFWYRRGNLAEGRQWLEGALARGGHLPASLRASALLRSALLASEREKAESLLRAARQELERALALAHASGDRRAIADATVSLAEVAHRTLDVDAALSYARMARQQMEALGDRVGLFRALWVMALLALWRGDRQTARPLMEELMPLCREMGDSEHLIHALGAMGHLARDEGDTARARLWYEESLALRRKMGNQLALAQSLEDFAVLAGREQQAERAVRLLGAAEAFCETLGARIPTADATDYERTVAEGRTALGEAAFARAWAEGRALSLEQAISLALENSSAPPGKGE
jgi:predicted ATPase/DNA-binding SARP family transcriptional activator